MYFLRWSDLCIWLLLVQPHASWMELISMWAMVEISISRKCQLKNFKCFVSRRSIGESKLLRKHCVALVSPYIALLDFHTRLCKRNTTREKIPGSMLACCFTLLLGSMSAILHCFWEMDRSPWSQGAYGQVCSWEPALYDFLSWTLILGKLNHPGTMSYNLGLT